MSTKQERQPHVGDLATHRGNQLDAREVAWVSEDKRWIRLQIGSIQTDDLPASNYRFRKFRRPS